MGIPWAHTGAIECIVLTPVFSVNDERNGLNLTGKCSTMGLRRKEGGGEGGGGANLVPVGTQGGQVSVGWVGPGLAVKLPILI